MQSKGCVQQTVLALGRGREAQLAPAVDSVNGALECESDAGATRHEATERPLEVTHVVAAQVAAAIAEALPRFVRGKQQPRYLDATGSQHEDLSAHLTPGPGGVDH